jgi:hypothetical protein
MAGLIPGWPIIPLRDGNLKSGDHIRAEVTDLLAARRVITSDPKRGKDASPVSGTAPAFTLIPALYEARPKLSAHYIRAFIASSVVASLALRLLPMRLIVAHVRRRRARRTSRGVAFDKDRARELTLIFHYLRPLGFSSRNECLRDSLTLIQFLSRYQQYPEWVFGVRTPPFAAHCWVQQDDIVFNDTPGHVNGYLPIMVV